ncbi:MAG: O-antigen ligase family protein [Pseudomonadota bacterium]
MIQEHNAMPIASMPQRRRLPISGDQVVLVFLGGTLILVGTDLFQITFGPAGLGAALRLLALAPVLFLLALYNRHVIRGAFAAPELAVLLALTVLSALWSFLPFYTAERLIPLIVTTCAGLMLGSMLSSRGLMVFLGLVFAATVLANIAAIGVLPSARGTPPWDNTWRGIYNHKNGLGGAMTVGVIMCLSLAVTSRGVLRAVSGAGVFLCLALLVASESRSAQLVFLFSITLLLIGLFYRRFLNVWVAGSLSLAVLVVVLGFSILATGVLDPVLEAFDRRPTLSGRIPLWILVWPDVQERFWFGYGYMSFWDPEARRVIEIARDPTLWHTPYYSHNGLIETLLNVGAVGMLLVLMTLFRTFAGIFIILRRDPLHFAIVPMTAFLVAFALMNVTESLLLSRNNMLWIIFVAIAAKIGIAARAVRKAEAADRHRLRSHRLGQYGPVTGAANA